MLETFKNFNTVILGRATSHGNTANIGEASGTANSAVAQAEALKFLSGAVDSPQVLERQSEHENKTNHHTRERKRTKISR